MKKITIKDDFYEFDNGGNKKYQLVNKLVAFYLAQCELSHENYASILEADRLLWKHYSNYLNNPDLCEKDAMINFDYILTNYCKYQ